MTLPARLRALAGSFTDLGDPVYWALAMGVVLVQDRDPVREGTVALVVVLALQVTALKLLASRRLPALALSTATQLGACAAGVSPTIGIGALVVCAASVYEAREHRRVSFVIAGAPASGTAFAVVGLIAFVPWVVHLRAAPLVEGPARATNPLVTAVVLLFAIAVRANWNFLDTLVRGSSQRAAEAEAARDRAIAEERARIARELHDVVAHQMSVVVAQAQGAEAVAEREPERAREALATIARTTRAALLEMRRLVSIDRPDGVAVRANGAPMPGIGVEELSQLADNAEAAGLEVRMVIEPGRGGTVPAGVALSAYRAVQEALTNAAKHAPGSCVEVQLKQTESSLRMEVTNGPSDRRPIDIPGSGVGLVGMRERVDFFGGTLSAGPTSSGGWSVVAVFPTLEPPPTSE